MRYLWLTTALLVAGGCSRGPAPGTLEAVRKGARPSGVKILLVGIDGATFQVLDPMMTAGKLPEIKRLKDEGAWGRLESIMPMFSPALWTSMVTGRSREVHGIEFFVKYEEGQREDGRRKERLVSVLDRRCLALWNITTAFDLSSGFLGWWATWPAEQVKGYMVSDRAVRDRYDEWVGGDHTRWRTYPESLMGELTPLLIDAANPPMEEIEKLVELTAEEKEEFLKVTRPVLRHGLSVFKFSHCNQRSYENIALHLLAKQGQQDLMGVFLVANDPISHTFWHYYEPEAFSGVDREKAARLGRLIPNYYEHNDRFLRELLSHVNQDTVVMIVSDHGFQASGALPEMKSKEDLPALQKSAYEKGQVAVGQSGMHHIDGVFIAFGGPIRKGVQIRPRIYDVAPTVLALLGLPVGKDMEGRVLTEIVDDSFWKKHPVQYVDSYEGLIPRGVPGETAGGEDPAFLDRLRALGYMR